MEGDRAFALALLLPAVRDLGYEQGMPGLLSLSLLIATSTLPSGQTFACTPTHVWDGDGPIWCAEGPKVRLAGIAAREMDGTCKSGHPCPEASAAAARDGLAKLLGKVTGTAATGHLLVKGPRLQCVSAGGAGGKRTAAWCRSPVHGDLSCAMVTAGLVERWARYWRSHRCL